MQVKGTLIFCDIAKDPVLKSSQASTVFCHDAFYFFKEKQQILDNLRKFAKGGSIILGHVHTNAVDHGVSGHPVSVSDYSKMVAEDSLFFTDSDLVDFWLNGNRDVLDENPKKQDTAVISWIENAPETAEVQLDQPAGELHLNPILDESGNGLHIKWPTPGYKKEYCADMQYLNDKNLEGISADEVRKSSGRERQEYFRKRFLLDTPQL